MFTRRKTAHVGLMILALIVLIGGAAADTIDGHWCTEDGSRLRINGEIVITPGGTRVLGEYDRHHLIFTLPSFEANGGKRVDMVLVSADTAHIRYSTGSDETSESAPEVWKRCKEQFSERPRSRAIARLAHEKATASPLLTVKFSLSFKLPLTSVGKS